MLQLVVTSLISTPEDAMDVEPEVRRAPRSANFDGNGAAGAVLPLEQRIERFQQHRFPPGHRLRDPGVEQELSLEVQCFGLQGVVTGELDARTGDVERHRRKHQAPVRQLEPALKVRRHALLHRLSCFAATPLAQFLDFALHVVVGEPGLHDPELAVETKTIDHVVLAWGEQEFRIQLERADHRRRRRLHHHLHDVFDARLVHRDVERDRPPVLSFRRVEHRAGRVQVRVQEPRIDRVQPGVAVGPVDERPVLHVERKRMTADRDREIGRVGLAVRLELRERAAEVAVRRQRAGDSLEDAEVGLGEHEGALERGVARFVAAPGTELAVDLDLAGRHAVGERRLERPRLKRTQVPHVQVVNRPDLRLLVFVERQDDETRVVGVHPIDDHTAILQRVTALFLRCRFLILARLAFRRLAAAFQLLLVPGLARGDVDVEPVEPHMVDVFAVEAHDAGVDVKGLDRDERRIVRHAAPADAQVGAFDAEARKRAQVQVAQFDFTVELVREVRDDSMAQGIR